MLTHYFRRMVRDRLAVRFPKAYRRRLDRLSARLPKLGADIDLPDVLAPFISAYYRADAEEMADAAAGRFDLLGRQVDFGGIDRIDWRYRLPEEHDHNLWRMKLCQLEILHSLVADGAAAHQDTALALLDSFEEATAFDRESPFKTIWAPYGASHRILAMLSGLALAQRHGALRPELEARLRTFIRRDAAFLRDNVEHDLRNNHTERNLAALCLYGMVAHCVPVKLARRLDREVAAIIRDTVPEDGMQVERSAMYQGLTVMSLRIFAATPFLSAEARTLAAQRVKAAEAAWLFMSHADGDIALFNDSWTEEVPQAAALLDKPGDVALPAMLPDAGYVRLTGDNTTLWMDVGRIGPAWNPGHGHADFLAVEMDVSGERFLVDPGTSQYSTGPVRAFERSAASHNGPHYQGVEPVDYLGCFKVGRMRAPCMLDPAVLATLCREAVGGTLETAAGVVRRVAINVPGSGILLADRWSQTDVAGVVRLLIPATWSMEVVDDRVLHFSNGPHFARLAVLHGRLVPSGSGQWCRRYMAPEQAHVIQVEPERSGMQQISVLLIGTEVPSSDTIGEEVLERCMTIGEPA
jgi:hypothetical protein